MNIGKSVRILMSARNIDNNKMAHDMGVTLATVCKYRTKEKMTKHVIRRIANYFDMSVDEFLAVESMFPDL